MLQTGLRTSETAKICAVVGAVPPKGAEPEAVLFELLAKPKVNKPPDFASVAG